MVADPITTIEDEILEKTTPKITAIIKDEAGVGIPATSINSLLLTLYNLDDAPTHTILNSRNAQNVLNTSNVVLDESGNLTWSTVPDDTAIVGTESNEKHRAVFEWTYNGGVKNGKYIIDMTIKNLEKTT
jgi:hypothetical protein